LVELEAFPTKTWVIEDKNEEVAISNITVAIKYNKKDVIMYDPCAASKASLPRYINTTPAMFNK
jgi:hypothetical protein